MASLSIDKEIILRRLKQYEHKISWHDLSYNKNLDISEYVFKHFPDKPWDWSALSQHPNIDFDQHVLPNLDKPWDWVALSNNPSVDLDRHILPNSDKAWDWRAICFYSVVKPKYPPTFIYNPKINFERHVLAYPDLPWYWRSISQNPTFLQVSSTNTDYIDYIFKIIKINKIKRQWSKTINNPEYLLCRNRLKSEYNELQQQCLDV